MIDYDAIASCYAEHRQASPRVLAHLVERTAVPPGRILEMGCGTANHLRALSAAWSADGAGFDRSPAMLAEARARGPRLDLREGDAAARFPFDDRSFDLAFSVDVIHYLGGSLPEHFAEAHRVLRPGGTVVTVTDSPEDIRTRSLTRYFPETEAQERARYPSIEAIEAAMRGAGFKVAGATHTAHCSPMTGARLERFRQKAYSSLRLIPEDRFRAGLARLEAEHARGRADLVEVYTYVWGRRDG
ncbi:MAG: class I SAM-dependent methyltransferase [Deltaproteobacteria bacterium]|nr:class I SAM-dependent methyltransferase [Deltaproteobacteria bacterium]